MASQSFSKVRLGLYHEMENRVAESLQTRSRDIKKEKEKLLSE